MTSHLSTFADHPASLRDWLVPDGVRDLTAPWINKIARRLARAGRGCLAENRDLKNKHRDQRCFILCSGPSIAAEDLRPLRNEICITTGAFYRFERFQDIRPAYHCIPNLDPYIEDRAVDFFREVDREIGAATLFLGASEFDFIQRRRLFPSRTVRWLLMKGSQFPDSVDALDPCERLPRPRVVAIMGLLLALCMGFREIHLLGVDHHSLARGTHPYCYDRKTLIQWAKSPTVTTDGKLIRNRLTEIQQYVSIWQQYLAIDRLAKSAGARITNLSQGSFLDVFPMGRLVDVIPTARP